VLISSRSGDPRAISEIASAGFKGKTSLLDDDLAAMMSLLNPLLHTVKRRHYRKGIERAGS
jgi:hypothetical protein